MYNSPSPQLVIRQAATSLCVWNKAPALPRRWCGTRARPCAGNWPTCRRTAIATCCASKRHASTAPSSSPRAGIGKAHKHLVHLIHALLNIAYSERHFLNVTYLNTPCPSNPLPAPRATPESSRPLPSTVPFVGPETQERNRGRPFKARIGANENVFGPSPSGHRRNAKGRGRCLDVW